MLYLFENLLLILQESKLISFKKSVLEKPWKKLHLKVLFIIVILEVFHLDVSGKDIKEMHSLNIPLT